MSAINDMLDQIEWTETGNSQPGDSDLPYATHTGVLNLGGYTLTVHQLSNGQRVIEAGELEQLGFLDESREKHL